MKKTLLFFICVLLIQISRAQTWCPPGAIWTYTMIPYGQPKSGVIKDAYLGDTVINGITCKHIRGTFKGKLSQWSPTVTVNNYRESYSHMTNQVLYTLVNSGPNPVFDTLVNFNAAVGDKWLKNRYFGTCNSRQVITVVNTGTVMINNVVLKKLVTTYTNTVYGMTGTYTVSAIDTIIERIMSRIDFMFPMHCEVDSAFYGYVTNGNFLCYQDDAFASYQMAGTSGCEYIPDALQELRPSKGNIRLYPNPASDMVTAEVENFNGSGLYQMRMINLLGQEVMQRELELSQNKLLLDVSALQKGVYFLVISGKENFGAVEKIRVE